MKISAINNNRINVITSNNKQKNNNKVAFRGIKETLNKNIIEVLPPSFWITTTATLFLGSPIIAELAHRAENKKTINEIGNFINSENYNKDSLKVKDFNNDGVLDFELVDKDGNKVVYDAKKKELLEYTTTLQKMQ